MLHDRRSALRVLFASSLILVAGAAHAAEPAYFIDASGTGASGFDVVAYVKDNAAVPGKAEITAMHDGVEWRFASDANKVLFIANPKKYLPQYGGYCAWAVAHGATAKTDPQAWTIVDGKLYLNFNEAVREKWRADQASQIMKADANWPKVLE